MDTKEETKLDEDFTDTPIEETLIEDDIAIESTKDDVQDDDSTSPVDTVIDNEDDEDEDSVWGDTLDPDDEIPDVPFRDEE